MFKYRNSLALRGLMWCLVVIPALVVLGAGKPKPPPPPPAPAVQYQLIDIGVGGPLAASDEMTAINADGVVIGNADWAWCHSPYGDWSFADVPYVIVPVQGANGKAVWFVDDGTGANALTTYLPDIEGALATEATCINNAGMIAGIAWHFNGVDFPTGSLVCWLGGRVQLLDLGVDCWEVRSLTSTGQLLVNGAFGSLLLSLDVAEDGTLYVADSLVLGPNLEASRMNDAGDVVGHDWDTRQAFLLRNAGTADAQFIALNVANESYATDINANGKIVGYARHYAKGQGDYCLACTWVVAADGGVATTELSTLPGISGKWTGYGPHSVNDQNQIVGYYSGPNVPSDGFFWQNGTMTDLLTTLVNRPVNVDYVEPDEINNDRVVVGRYHRTDGVWRDCVLVPVTP